MTQEEINKGNRLIERFMGKDVIVDTVIHQSGQRTHISESNYHSSWDLLMQAVEKIEKMGYFCMINKWSSVYTGSDGERIQITTVSNNTKILNTWKAIIEFIKFYNTNISKK